MRELNACEESRQTRRIACGIDEKRQLDELLRAAQEVAENNEDLTSQPGAPCNRWREPEELVTR